MTIRLAVVFLLPVALAGMACQAARPPTPRTAAAIAHGGLGNPEHSDGPRAAVDAALAVLEAGGDPVDAAVAGVVVLEDDPRFNAGTGSRVRIDGETVQMDASLMDSDGRFAAVAAIERVKNPVLVARAVLGTPHLLLAGDGATRFARALGMPDYDPRTRKSIAKSEEVRRKLEEADPTLPHEWKAFHWRRHWNFRKTLAAAGLDAGHDTVGVVARSADGRFAAALSTGGTNIALHGRVGDVPIYGAGLYAGPHGAAAATGDGERIIDAMLAREVYGWLAAGLSPEEAARRGVGGIAAKGESIGLVVLGATGMQAASSRPMAWAGREAGSPWQGPQPEKGKK